MNGCITDRNNTDFPTLKNNLWIYMDHEQAVLLFEPLCTQPFSRSGQCPGISRSENLTKFIKLLWHGKLGSYLTVNIKLELSNWIEFWLGMRQRKTPKPLLSRARNGLVLLDIWWKYQATQKLVTLSCLGKVFYIIRGSIYCNVAILLQGKKKSFFMCQSLWDLAPIGRLNKCPDKLMQHHSK